MEVGPPDPLKNSVGESWKSVAAHKDFPEIWEVDECPVIDAFNLLVVQTDSHQFGHFVKSVSSHFSHLVVAQIAAFEKLTRYVLKAEIFDRSVHFNFVLGKPLLFCQCSGFFLI